MSERSKLEMYQAFMSGYVKRINEATLNVTIGGIRIGTAKYSRLAQINLHTRIITFSRFAIENVPERGRRYLVLHELAHVKEASHNRHFWDLVDRYEPDYKRIGRSLDLAFKRNVREDQQILSRIQVPNPLSGRLEDPKLLLAGRLINYQTTAQAQQQSFEPEDSADDAQSVDSFICLEDEFDPWADAAAGVIHGGADEQFSTTFGGTPSVEFAH
ncbi:MAG TPA: M48 family metallopeptidase [Trichormus sp.]|jgi:hypothetical protein